MSLRSRLLTPWIAGTAGSLLLAGVASAAEPAAPVALRHAGSGEAAEHTPG